MELTNAIEKIISHTQGDVAVFLKNCKTKDCIKINENKVFPSASTIKLIIMAELLRQVNEGKLSLDDEILLTDKVKAYGDGILKELDSGHYFTLRELMTLMIIISDNTATNIIIDIVGMDNVNNFSHKIGLKHTKLRRKMMDTEAARAGEENFTSAFDMGKFLYLLFKKKMINNVYSDMMVDVLKRQQVKGRLDLYLPESTVIAHKTGDLDRLEHDVGILYLPNCQYILCVLTNKTRTNNEGREIIGKISWQVYDKLRKDN